MAGNNNQCDSVTSTGGKESESGASKRTKKNTRSRYGDFLWT